MPRKPTRKTLKANLDREFSKVVRKLGECERCGNTETLQCAHFISRANLQIRWDKDNANCFCAGCHFWSHQRPDGFVEFMQQKLGEKRYKALRERSMGARYLDLPMMLKELKNE
jgi:hypothetical protein